MSREYAIKYLKYLHSLEEKSRSNLFTHEITSLLEKVRLEFIVAYNKG